MAGDLSKDRHPTVAVALPVLVLVVATALVLTVGLSGSAEGALPAECEGDTGHCVVLTTFEGVNVYRNRGVGGFCPTDASCTYPANRYGARWQCVELFNRFFSQRFGAPAVPGDARELYFNASGIAGLESRPNGGDEPPVPGDAVVFTNSGVGHVAIVVAVTDTEVHVVEQNVPGDGTNRYRYDPASNRIHAPTATSTALGWIHAQANA